MSQQVDGDKSYLVDGTVAIAQYSRVRLSSGYLVAAGLNEDDLGTLNEAVFVDGVIRSVSVRGKEKDGTSKMIAAGAIAQYADVFTAAAGKIDDTPSTRRVGFALEAATGNNSIIEVKRTNLGAEPTPSIKHNTADATLTRDQRNSTQTNLGASGAVVLTLPQDAVAGDSFHFAVMAAQQLRIDPGAAGAIYINGAKQSDDAYIHADDEGESVTLVADGNGDWASRSAVGTWTVV